MARIAYILSVLASLLPIALAASSGCGTTLAPNLRPGTSTHNVTISSRSVIGKTTTREYILYLPKGYAASNDKAAPLVFAFHGQQQPAWSMEKITQLSDPAFNPDAVVVYPQGMNVQPPGVQFLGDPMAPTSNVIDDRVFVDEILTNLTSTLCIDEKKVYATGISNGGSLVGLLMCDSALNKAFAAFATVGGAFYPDTSLKEPLFQKDCRPDLNEDQVLPYMNLHGLNDTVVPYDGHNNPPFIPVMDWVETWVKNSKCTHKPYVETAEKGTVIQKKWACKAKRDVIVHRAIEHFGHGWPSVKNQGEPFETLRGGPTTWNATTFMLKWFEKWGS
ncbi:hypothetical protein ACJQWK_01296 [Exserohilum turcicum]|uniref:feruloyl esterase n=1 Tax=Exserohilum turcicum (strain 28A) TaxID=671987 RepID=R0JTH3_EXST2|nr:uncharacterized protein SETTUDRAFT_93584 [Exserohilum turcica Et28A]EOA84373.1 hypothetical protein SETTUDRAFT_93584 [Exserohilum turcica Et28A]